MERVHQTVKEEALNKMMEELKAENLKLKEQMESSKDEIK